MNLITKYKNGDYKTRSVIIACFSMIGCFIMAFAKIVLGIYVSSIFFVASGFYSIGMGVSRAVYLIGENKIKNNKIINEAYYYLYVAAILLIAAIMYICYMLRFVIANEIVKYDQIVSIAIATMAFFELGASIYGLCKVSKMKDLLFKSLQVINFMTALCAIVLTQMALLSFSSDMDVTKMNIYNGSFGIGIAVINIVISIIMIIKGAKLIKTNNHI